MSTPQTVDNYHDIMALNRTMRQWWDYVDSLTTHNELNRARNAIREWGNKAHPLRDEKADFKRLYSALIRRGQRLGFTRLTGGQWVEKLTPIPTN